MTFSFENDVILTLVYYSLIYFWPLVLKIDMYFYGIESRFRCKNDVNILTAKYFVARCCPFSIFNFFHNKDDKAFINYSISILQGRCEIQKRVWKQIMHIHVKYTIDTVWDRFKHACEFFHWVYRNSFVISYLSINV